ncbi:hypothetical protein OESDEN_13242 [Oesophagostomum dentatum]|uniref:Uncharacterized protein n=1 Tax=Oesophagostomum dentatum TaxID=61180 RepID=A0A0B1STZ2_OESDE|nr:hypothetical protein OESDEN_13242 [Oesophagostomum dentatum]
MLLVLWCMPEPEASIAVTIIFVVAIVTDKPLMMIWLTSRAYMKWCKGDTVAQEDKTPEKVRDMSMTTTTTADSSNDIPANLNKEKVQDKLSEVFIDSGKGRQRR